MDFKKTVEELLEAFNTVPKISSKTQDDTAWYLTISSRGSLYKYRFFSEGDRKKAEYNFYHGKLNEWFKKYEKNLLGKRVA